MNEFDQLLAMLEEEEETIRFKSFTNEGALQMGLRFVEIAEAEDKRITIDIRRNGQQLFHYAMPGTSPDNDAWIERKIRVVNRFYHSSYYMGVSCKAKNATLSERYLVDPYEYAAHGGAFPLTVENVGTSLTAVRPL